MSFENIEIKHHYHQKWVKKIFRTSGITFGRHIFYKEYKSRVSQRLIKHEIEHVRQYNRYRLWGQWWIAIPLFLIVYTGQWVKVGFRYKQIRYEIEARAAEKKK